MAETKQTTSELKRVPSDWPILVCSNVSAHFGWGEIRSAEIELRHVWPFGKSGSIKLSGTLAINFVEAFGLECDVTLAIGGEYLYKCTVGEFGEYELTDHEPISMRTATLRSAV